MTKDSVAQARAAGYSEEEIKQRLSQIKPQYANAFDSGYSVDEVVAFVETKNKPKDEREKAVNKATFDSGQQPVVKIQSGSDQFVIPTSPDRTQSSVDSQARERVGQERRDDIAVVTSGGMTSVVDTTDPSSIVGGDPKKFKTTDEEVEPTAGQIAAGIVAEIAIAEGSKAASTATGATIGGGFGVAGGPAAPATIPAGAAIGAGVGYVTGALGGGWAGSIVAQGIEGRKDINYGRAAVSALMNLVPGSKITKGPKALIKASEAMAKRPIATTAAVGAVAGTSQSAATQYAETGAIPDTGEILKSGVISSVLGAGLGASSKVGQKLLGRYANKSEDEINRLIRSGDRGAIAYINALSNVAGDVDPSSFMTTKDVGEYVRRLGDYTLSRTAPSKLIGPEATQAMRDAQNIATAGREIGGLLGEQVKQIIDKSPDKDLSRTLALEYLTGVRTSLPNQFKGLEEKLSKFRGYVKEYQQKLLDNHYSGQRPLDDALRVSIENSMNSGDYVTRAYKFFDDSNYKPSKGQVDALKKRLIQDGMSSQKVDEFIGKLNEKKAGSIDDLHSSLFTQNAGILKTKKDLSPELRAYLGEYVEPGEIMAQTMSKLARLTAYDEADSIVAKTMLDAGILFRPGDSGFTPDMKPIKLRRGVAREGETELYGTDDVQYAIGSLYGMKADDNSFNVALKATNDAWDAAVAGSKATKVLLNPPSYLVNAWSGLHSILGMGMNPFKGFKTGTKMAAAQFADSPLGKIPGFRKLASQMDLPTIDEFKKYKELGLVPQGLTFADIQAGFRDKGISGKLQKAIEPVGKLYSIPDIIARFSVQKNNESFLYRAFPGASDDVVAKQAAILTNATFQNYDYVNNGLKTLSRKGVASPFATFSFELMRNQYNQGRLAGSMIKGSFADMLEKSMGVPANRSAIRLEGVKRIASLATLYSAYATGMSMLNRQTTTPEQEQAIRETVLPSWDSNKPLAIQFGDDGKIRTMNSSYLVPHMQAAAPFFAGFRGDSLQDAIKAGVLTLSEDIGGEGSFPMITFAQALANHSFKTGEKISKEPDQIERAQDLAGFVVKDLFEPGIMREYNRSKIQTPQVTAARQAGIRINETTIEEGASRKITDLRESLNAVAKDLASARFNVRERGMTTQEFDQRFTEINDTHKRNLEVLNRHVNNLRTLGKTDDQVADMLKKARMGPERILSALSGETPDLDKLPIVSISERYADIADGDDKQTLDRIRKVILEDRPLGESLLRHHKQILIDRRLKISTTEKLVKSLSSSDGARARYIFRQMQASSNPDAVFQNYYRKRVIDADTFQQIQLLKKSAKESY